MTSPAEIPFPRAERELALVERIEIEAQHAFARALAIAVAAHEGQLDKCGAPYILHPLQVAMRLGTWRARVVGILHDVIEDCGWTRERLVEAGIPEECADAVEALSRREGEVYAVFLDRIVAAGPLAMRVKLADLAENSRPDRQHPEQEGLSKRYLHAHTFIFAALAAHSSEHS